MSDLKNEASMNSLKKTLICFAIIFLAPALISCLSLNFETQQDHSYWQSKDIPEVDALDLRTPRSAMVMSSESLKSWRIDYRVTGGFAGMQRQLIIASDSQLVAIDQKRNQYITRKALPDQVSQIRMLLKIVQHSNPPQVSSRLKTSIADTLQYELTLKLNDSPQRSIHLDDSTLQLNLEYTKLIQKLSEILNSILAS